MSTEQTQGLDLNDFMTDAKKEDEGVKVQLGGGTFIRVASSSSDNYVNRLAELLENSQAVLDLGGKPADALAKEAMYIAASEHLLKGWNVPIDGKPVKYTPEVGFQSFMKARHFYKMVKGHADSISLFAIEREVKDTKN